MKVDTTAIEGVITIEPEIFADERGYFLSLTTKELFNRQLGTTSLLFRTINHAVRTKFYADFIIKLNSHRTNLFESWMARSTM